MAENTEDLNSLRVDLDMARRPPAPSVSPPPPGPGPEMAEALAEGKGGGVGGKAAPDLAAPSYAGVQDGMVLLAPPGFTVCESFFDSGEFTCFHPEIVCGTEVTILNDGTFQMGDDIWCNVTVEDGSVSDASLDTTSDPYATVSVHVADIRPGGVKQYHVGAIVLGTGTGGGGGGGGGGECIRPWDIRYFEDVEVWGVYLPSLANGGDGAELNVSGTEIEPKDYGGDPLVEVDGHPGYFEVPLVRNDGEEGEEEGEVMAPTAFWLHVFVYKCYDTALAEYLAENDLVPDPVAIITPEDSAAVPADAPDYGYGTWEPLTKIRICGVDSENNVIQYVAGEIDLTRDDVVDCAPFAVRWNTVAQRWMVFLPDVENLVYFSDAPVEIEEIDGSVAEGLAIYGGWYWFGFSSAASAIYLVVTVTDETGEATAEISPEPGTAESGETVYNLLVATMETDQETGAKSVNQLITGAVALGGGGGGGAPTYPTVDDPSAAVQSISIVPLSGTVDQYDANHRGAIKIVSGNLEIGDGTNGTTEGELYFDEEYATEYIDTVPISSVVDPNVLTY